MEMVKAADVAYRYWYVPVNFVFCCNYSGDEKTVLNDCNVEMVRSGCNIIVFCVVLVFYIWYKDEAIN